MVRTIDEVYERLQKGMKSDKIGLYFEFRGKILASYLPKEMLEKIGIEPTEDFKPLELNEETIINEMKEYFPFAVDKAICERGISASRSVEHYEEWIWLLGDDKFLEEIRETEYAWYGKPILLKIAKKYGFDYSELELI